jgi:nitrogenase molybdenum-iron protein beta chain
MQTTGGESGQAGLRTPHFLSDVSTPCSNMLERDVIFGGERKLRGAIDGAIEIIDADAYFVLTGCTAGIIGDDIESVTREYKDRGLRVYSITTPGFAGDSNLGYEAAFQSLIDNIVEGDLERQPDLVNLFGVIPFHEPFWEGTLEEFTRLFQKLGLRVNTFFSGNQGIEHIRSSSSASLNIILNPWLLQSAEKHYRERFGVPSLRFPGIPIGATDTTKLVRAVGKALDLDKTFVNEVTSEEEAYIYHYFERIIGRLGWKRFAVVGEAAVAVGVTRFLANDYSFTPVVTIISDPVFRDSDRKLITKQITDLEYAKAPDVFFETDHYRIMEILESYDDITLLVGSTLEREVALKWDVQCHVMSFPVSDKLVLNRTYGGYRGSLTLIEDLYNNL